MKTGFEPIIGKMWTQKVISCLSYYVMLKEKKDYLLLIWNNNACLIVSFSTMFWNYPLYVGKEAGECADFMCGGESILLKN